MDSMPALTVEADSEFAALADDTRRQVRAWQEALRPLAQMEEYGRQSGLVKAVAARFGVSVQSVYRRLYAFRKTGWRGLVDRRQVRDERQLPPQFVQHWKRLVEEEQRSSKHAWRRLIHAWRYTDEPVPGYRTPPPAAPGGTVPAGWTYRNLMRLAPSKYELRVARVGRRAARGLAPLVLTTRAGLHCGEFYMFDDLEHDLKVNFLGVNRRAMRPLELCALDLFSGAKVAYGLKPTIEGDDGTKQKIKEREMRFLLAYLLTQVGYRREGTTLVVEHGTAAIREDIESVLANCSEGAIRVQRSGIEGAPALLGWYEGRSKGNFRLKAALEAHHSLSHNATALLPGQMGKDRDHAPEELHGRDRINDRLLKAVGALPAEKAELLRFPFISYAQFAETYDWIVRYINARSDHDLEGYEAAGLVAQEYRLEESSSQWLPAQTIARLPAEQRAAFEALIQRPGMVRLRKLAPAEVWHRGRRELAKLPIWVVPQILGADLAVERKLGPDGQFHFQDRELSADGFVFPGKVRNQEGYELLLRERETYRTFVNPFDPSLLIVCREDGGFLGVARRTERVPRQDPLAVAAAMGRAAHAERLRLTDYRARHAGDVDQVEADAEHNRMVLAGAPVTAAEKAHERLMDETSVSRSEIAAGAGRAGAEHCEEAERILTAAEVDQLLGYRQ